MDNLKSVLMQPQPLRILVCSPSDATLALLNTMLHGFYITSLSSIHDVETHLRSMGLLHSPLDFVILDDQSETRADDLARFLPSLGLAAFKDTKIIHLYTPTTDSLSGHAIFSSKTPGVVKMTKPPRKARLLQTLAGLKNLPNAMSSGHTSAVAKAVEDLQAAQRTLYGNVLVAEGIIVSSLLMEFGLTYALIIADNPIAQNLLVKQLQRYQLNVVATNNGEEALEGKPIRKVLRASLTPLKQNGNHTIQVTSALHYLTTVSFLTYFTDASINKVFHLQICPSAMV